MPDALHDRADDWQIATCGAFAAAVTAGGGVFLYAFRSKKLRAFEIAFLCAAGIGAGGNQSGIDPQNIQNKELNFSKPKVFEPFSMSDIHKTGGYFSCAAADAGMIPGVGPLARKALSKVPINYGVSTIVAWKDVSHSYFLLRGFGLGVGSTGGAVFLSGLWYSYQPQSQFHKSSV